MEQLRNKCVKTKMEAELYSFDLKKKKKITVWKRSNLPMNIEDVSLAVFLLWVFILNRQISVGVSL